jgi:hypothetical protein
MADFVKARVTLFVMLLTIPVLIKQWIDSNRQTDSIGDHK